MNKISNGSEKINLLKKKKTKPYVNKDERSENIIIMVIFKSNN